MKLPKTLLQLCSRTAMLAVLAHAAVSTNAFAAGDAVARWNLGEQDPGAVAGNPGNATTTDAITSPGNDLAQTGSPTYDANVPAGGSTLAMSFAGGSYYRSDAVQALTNNFDYDNFSLSFDCYGTSNPDYNAPVSMGLYSQRSSFFYMNGGNWRFNMNGGGDFTIAPYTLNAWQHLEWKRSQGTNYWYLNGVQVGPTGNTTVGAGTFSPVLAIGGIARGAGGNFDAPGGDWLGYVDNVVVTNLNIGEPPTIGALSVSPTKIYAGNSIIINGSGLSGDTAGLTYIVRTNGINLAAFSTAPVFINGVTTNYSGNYDIVVTNNFGSATSSIVSVSVLPSAGAEVMRFRMGDNDPGAVAGNPGNPVTVDAIFGNNLNFAGAPVYSANVPSGGGVRSMGFDGGSSYGNTNLAAFLANLDQANYSISAYAYCTDTNNPGVVFALGAASSAASRGIIISQANGRWLFVRPNVQTVDFGPVVTNTWTKIEIQRRDFGPGARIRVFLNGQDAGFEGNNHVISSPYLNVGASFADDGITTQEGFIGQIDNVVIHNFSIGGLPSVTSGPTALPDSNLAANEALTLTATMSGGTPASFRWRRDGVVLTNDLTGTTSTVLLANPMAGNYDVIVSNSPAGVVTSSIVAITIDSRSDSASAFKASYNLGEQDPGAANGVAGNAQTRQFEGVKDMSRFGTPSYTNNVPAGGSTLAMALNGSTDRYSVEGQRMASWFAIGFNPDNFSLSCHAYPTGDGVQGFSVAMGIGSSGNNYFIYHAGGSWFVHKNGSGNIMSGPAVALNTWVKHELRRGDFGAGLETKWFIDGAEVASTTVPANPTPVLTIGSNRRGVPLTDPNPFEGPFLGLIDNVVLESFAPSLDIVVSGGVSTVSMKGGKINSAYRLERTLTLSPAVWTTVDTQTTDANGAVSLTDSAPPADAAFYRAVTP